MKGSDWHKTDSDCCKIQRGGGWSNGARNLCASYSYRGVTQVYSLGFRLVLR